MIVEIDCSRLEIVRSSDKSFNSLVLDDDTEETVRALMSRLKKKGSVWSADFVEGKGTGGIILLHGEHI
jgi:hypothetical protein